MKKVRLISIFTFLAAMIFTVFQYVPILEEETPAHKVELAKKVDNADGDTDTSDEDCDGDSEPLFHSFFYSSFISFYSIQSSYFRNSTSLYTYQLANIHTPPPKA